MGYARELAELATAYNTGSPLTHRNKIINGGMVIDQRNAGATVTPADGAYSIDRFNTFKNGGGSFTIGQSSTAPAGFSKSLLLTVTTADSSIVSGDYYLLTQPIEGYNIVDLAFGTASAKTVTASFWIRASVTGTFCFSLRQGAGSRSYVSNYTIDQANTWEYKTITIPGDTSGSYDSVNGVGLLAGWDFGSGSDRNATVNTWSGGNYFRTSGATNLIATSGATFYLTGVQLEAGRVATPFEMRSYGAELALCQRYFEKSFAIGTAPANGVASTEGTDFSAYYSSGGRTKRFDFKVTKRATPTITAYGGAPSGGSNVFGYYNYTSWVAFTTTTPESITDSAFRCECTKAAAFSTNGLTYLLDSNWTASAEL